MDPRFCRCFGLVMLAVTVRPAFAAEPDNGGSSPAPGRSRVAPILPTVQLSASTSGNAELKGAADIVAGISDDWDVAFEPMVSVSTKDGAGTLFTVKNGAAQVSTPWSVGLSVTFLELAPERDPLVASESTRLHFEQAKSDAYNICTRVCDVVGDPPEDCKDFHAWRTGQF